VKILPSVLFWGGILALLVGLLWIGQGTGIFPYPRQSFMIDQTPWAYRGVLMLVIGAVAIVLGRRLRVPR
jgi:hypothetical protein